jgi:hypothetical protein
MTAPTIAQIVSANNASAANVLVLGTIGTSGTVNFAPVVGDVIVAWGACERASATDVITDTGSTGWTLLQNNANTNHTNGIYWKRLASGDLTAVVSATASGGLTRRQTGGFIILHGSADPVINNKTAVTSATTAASANAMTPSVADSLLMTLFSSVSTSSPFARTFGSHTSSFIEQLQNSSTAAASSNPFFVLSTKALTGGSGVSQTFDAVTISSASEYNATSFVMAPNANLAPTATLSASAYTGVAAGSTITLTLGGSDDVAVVSGTLTQLSGPTATPTLFSGTAGMPGATYHVTAPSVTGGTTIAYGYTTLDGGGLSSSQATASIDIDPGVSGAPTVAQTAGGGLVSAGNTLTLGTVGTSGTVNFAPVVGDLVLAWGTAERASATPVIHGGSTAWTSLVDLTNTNHTTGLYWKRLTSADLTMTITADIGGGLTRRISGGFIILHHSLDPVTNVKTAVTSATTAASANSMTPTVADSLLLAFFTSVSTAVPWARNFSAHTNGFTEILEVTGTAAALSNPFSAVATKTLIGGTSAQTFDAPTISSPSEYNAVSFVFAPGTVNLPPTATLTADKTSAVEPGETVTLTLGYADDVAVTSVSLTQPDGEVVELIGTGGSGSTRYFVAPYTLYGDILTFSLIVSDGTLSSSPATVGIEVLMATERVVITGGSSPVEIPLIVQTV